MSRGQCKNGESNFTFSLVLKRDKIQLGAGVIRFADISVILTIGGYIIMPVEQSVYLGADVFGSIHSYWSHSFGSN